MWAVDLGEKYSCSAKLGVWNYDVMVIGQSVDTSTSVMMVAGPRKLLRLSAGGKRATVQHRPRSVEVEVVSCAQVVVGFLFSQQVRVSTTLRPDTAIFRLSRNLAFKICAPPLFSRAAAAADAVRCFLEQVFPSAVQRNRRPQGQSRAGEDTDRPACF